MLTEHAIKSSWIFSELPLHSLREQALEIWDCAPVARKFLDECYTLAPHHLVLWIIMRLVISMSGAASLYISSLLLDLVESFIENRDPSPRRLMLVAAARLLFSLFQWLAHEILYVLVWYRLRLPIYSYDILNLYRGHSERVLREKLGRHMSAYKVQG